MTEVQIPWHIEFTVDVNDLIDKISNAISQAANREGFVKSACNKLYYGGKERCNSMVFNMNVEHENHLQNVLFYQEFVYAGIPYGMWLFENGRFVRKGDGGYINWSFAGWFDQNGGEVIFRTPGPIGTHSGSIC